METLKELLTEEDKKFIIENYNNMNVMQMAIRLGIKTESRKCPIISDFIKLAKLQTKNDNKIVELKNPEPTVEQKLENIVQEEISEVPEVSEEMSPINDVAIQAFAEELKQLHIRIREPLSEREKIDIKFLMYQMQATRYRQIYLSFRRKEFKTLFKEEFIRAMYGKGEMPQEEVNDFIDLCSELVYQYDSRCKIKELDKILDDKDFPKEKRVGIIEVQRELNNAITQSTKRVGEIKEGLGTLREQRVKDNKNVGLTIGALFEAFYDSEKREKMISLQDIKNKELMDALDKIDALDETKALIMGISKDELKLGGL